MSDLVFVVNDLVNVVARQAKIREEQKNRRSDRRYSVHWRAQLGDKNENDGAFAVKMEVWAKDLSNVGTGFLGENPLTPDTTMYVRLQPSDSDSQVLPIIIRRCEQLTTNIYQIGAEFLFDQPDEQPQVTGPHPVRQQ